MALPNHSSIMVFFGPRRRCAPLVSFLPTENLGGPLFANAPGENRLSCAVMRSERLQGIALMVLAALLFAIMSALIKYTCDRIDPFVVVFWRGVVGWGLLVGLARLRGAPPRKGVDRRRLFERSLFGTIALMSYVWAIDHIGLGVASALNQSSPVFVAILAPLLLDERAPRAVPPLILLAFGGAWMIISPDLTTIDGSAVVGLGSGAFAGLAYVYVRRLRATETPDVIVRWFAGWSALFCLPIFPFVIANGGWVWPDVWEWLALVAVGVTGLLGQLAMTQSLRRERAAVVSPFIYFAVAASLGFGWMFWNEWPGTLALLGVAVIVVANVAIGWASNRKAEQR